MPVNTLNDRLLAVGANVQDPTVGWLFRFDLADGALIDSINYAYFNFLALGNNPVNYLISKASFDVN